MHGWTSEKVFPGVRGAHLSSTREEKKEGRQKHGCALCGQTVQGSFSAVSAPIFATKYSFWSVFRDPQDCHTFAPLEIQIDNKSFKVHHFSEI